MNRAEIKSGLLEKLAELKAEEELTKEERAHLVGMSAGLALAALIVEDRGREIGGAINANRTAELIREKYES